MKKHWKKILAAFVTVFLIIGGYLIYLFQFKEYDTADSEVSEITRETYKIDLPDGSSIELDEDGNIIESAGNDSGTSIPTSGNTGSTSGNTGSNDSTSSESGSSTAGNSGSSDSTSGNTSNGSSGTSTSNGATGSNGSGSTGSTGSTGGSTGNSGSSSGSGSSNEGSTGTPATTPSGTSATVASIKQKYEPVMGSLQTQASDRIDALVGRALNEYQTKKANGESINYAYFYNKYSSAASELEGRTDKVFYQIVGVIEKELKANGLAASHAQSFVSQYEAEKEARRDALLNKAMNR